jgi:hypothetical protein
MRGLPRWFVFVLGGIALAALVLVNGADAATSCPSGDEACAAITERLDSIGLGIAALPTTDAEYDYAQVLAEISTNTANVPNGEQAVSGVVALGADDADRLDLIWVGIWLLAGLTIGTWFASKVWGEFRQWFHA